MRISDLSARTGFPASTLRFYESEGLLPAGREANGYRVYGEDAVDRLSFIAQAKHLDLPLPAVRELVTAWESEPCHSVRATYRPMLVDRATQVDERIGALRALRGTLTAAVARLDALPDRDTPCDASCSFLDRQPPPLPLAMPARTPIACTLDGHYYPDRVAAWRSLVADAPRAEVDGGMRVTLPAGALGTAAALAQAEQGCCSFYLFRIDLHGATFELTVTAPSEARQMLDDLIPRVEAA